jgi:cell division protein ZapA
LSSEHEIEIYGQTYRIKGDDPERIDKVASYLDEMMTSLLGDPGQGLSTKNAVLVSLNVADEWHKNKEKVEKAFVDLNQRIDELLGILQE